MDSETTRAGTTPPREVTALPMREPITVMLRAQDGTVMVSIAGRAHRVVWPVMGAAPSERDVAVHVVRVCGSDDPRIPVVVAEVQRLLSPSPASRRAVLAAGFDVVAFVEDGVTRMLHKLGWCAQHVDADDAADVVAWAHGIASRAAADQARYEALAAQAHRDAQSAARMSRLARHTAAAVRESRESVAAVGDTMSAMGAAR